VQILSIQPGSDDSGSSRRRRSTDTSQQLDVLLAVQKSDSRYFRSNLLKRRIQSITPSVEQQSGVRVLRVFNSVCERDSCVGVGVDCVTEVSLDADASPLTIVADRDSFVSLPHHLTVKCVCRPGESLETASANIVAGGIMFPECLCIRASVHLNVRGS